MIELEILFSSGQGILVPFEDREKALRFMKQAMEYDSEETLDLYHLSTPYEELLIDLADICFIRLKKENYPRIGATLKIPERTSYHQYEEEVRHRKEQREEHRKAAHEKQEKAAHPEDKERHFTVDPSGNVADDERNPEVKDKERHFTVDPSGKTQEDPLHQKYEQAEARLKKAEKRLEQVDKQRLKVEERLKQTSEELEDAVREADLRKKIEDIEISKEISKMKEQQND